MAGSSLGCDAGGLCSPLLVPLSVTSLPCASVSLHGQRGIRHCPLGHSAVMSGGGGTESQAGGGDHCWSLLLALNLRPHLRRYRGSKPGSEHTEGGAGKLGKQSNAPGTVRRGPCLDLHGAACLSRGSTPALVMARHGMQHAAVPTVIPCWLQQRMRDALLDPLSGCTDGWTAASPAPGHLGPSVHVAAGGHLCV